MLPRHVLLPYQCTRLFAKWRKQASCAELIHFGFMEKLWLKSGSFFDFVKWNTTLLQGLSAWQVAPWLYNIRISRVVTTCLLTVNINFVQWRLQQSYSNETSVSLTISTKREQQRYSVQWKVRQKKNKHGTTGGWKIQTICSVLNHSAVADYSM